MPFYAKKFIAVPDCVVELRLTLTRKYHPYV